MEQKARKAWLVLLISIVLMFVSSLCANLTQSNGGKVDVVEINQQTSNGTLSMLMYRPADYSYKEESVGEDGKVSYTTKHRQLPCVIAVHGNLDHKETQDIALVELSRRGVIVIAIDMYSHGHSSVAEQGKDILDAMDFVQTLDYVDKSKIGLTGHSLGAVLIQTQPAFSGRLGEISAILTTGWDVVLPELLTAHTNMGSVVAKYDEFFFYLNMLDAEKEKLLVGETGEVLYNTVEEYNTARMKTFMSNAGVSEEPAFGKIYRNTNDKLRVVYQVESNHPWVHFSNKTGRAMVEFFGQSFGIDFESASGISNSSMIWGLKTFFNAIGLVGFFVFVVSFVLVLLNTKVFGMLKATKVSACGESLLDGETPIEPSYENGNRSEIVFQDKTMPKSKLSIAIYSIALVIFALLPGLLYFPLVTSEVFFKFEASPNDVSAAFPFEYPNHIITWVFFITIILAAIFVIYYLLERFVLKAQPKLTAKQTLKSLGLTVKPQNIIKTILVPALTICVSYAVLSAFEYLFNTDFRLYTLAVKTFPTQTIPYIFVYGWFFLAFYIVVGVINNAMAREGIKEWANILVMVLCNTISLVFVLAFYYLSFFNNGIPMFNQSIAPVLLLPLIPLLATTTIFGRILYKKCGNVYLPALLNSVLVTLITISCTRYFYMG